jgi:hypothetical protein
VASTNFTSRHLLGGRFPPPCRWISSTFATRAVPAGVNIEYPRTVFSWGWWISSNSGSSIISSSAAALAGLSERLDYLLSPVVADLARLYP